MWKLIGRADVRVVCYESIVSAPGATLELISSFLGAENHKSTHLGIEQYKEYVRNHPHLRNTSYVVNLDSIGKGLATMSALNLVSCKKAIVKYLAILSHANSCSALLVSNV